MKTTLIKTNEDSGSVPPCEMNPKRPDIELVKINKADTAAACFIVAQPNNSKTGLKIIPPPIPNKPDKKPIKAPNPNAKGRLISFSVFFS